MKFTEDSLFVAPTPLRLAEELAGWFYSQIFEKTNHSKQFHVAISGGSTPILFFNHLAAKYGHHIDWTYVHFFWVDERCVPPSSNDSNYKNAQTNLLSKINIPESNIHRIKGENIPTKEATRYAEELASTVNLKDGIPCFDLILLGMGDDGHTASLFPGQDNLFFSGNLVEASENPKTGQKRVTLTPYCINNALKVVFQVTGISKSGVVCDILQKNQVSNNYPAKQIKPSNGDLYWFLDAGASKGLIS
jgi:6-phosphogluconolactonase